LLCFILAVVFTLISSAAFPVAFGAPDSILLRLTMCPLAALLERDRLTAESEARM
jgi:hypothetical protein